MENKNSIKQDPDDKLGQLEKEIQTLRAENRQLRDDQAKALSKLEQQVLIEKKHAESQSRFETIFYESKLGNKIINPDLRIIQINAALLGMLGYREEEIIGTRIITLAHPDFIDHWYELQHNLWTKQIPSFQFETCLIRKDGSSVWCRVTSILFRDDETNLGYTVVEDISERKALEVQQKKLYEHQETIMHIVAHDLKSPINNIGTLNNYLKKNLEDLPAAESRRKEQSLSFIGLISDTCEKAYAIIDDLLFIGAFKSKQSFEKTDLQAFISSLLPSFQLQAKKKEIQINFDHPQESVYADIDGVKFTRMLENLISNAIKFTHRGGQINISLKKESQKVLLQVSDNGIGIPKKIQDSIFQKFTKAKRKGTEEESTTGLGLYIVEEIVKIHNGKVWVESQENVGSSFFIELP